MGWRTVAITRRAKLDLQMGHLVVRNEDLIKINIDEISVLLIECTAVSLTAALLAELTRKKVKVIFCDEKRLPSSELIPYYGSHDTSLKYRRQAMWTAEGKDRIWTAGFVLFYCTCRLPVLKFIWIVRRKIPPGSYDI